MAVQNRFRRTRWMVVALSLSMLAGWVGTARANPSQPPATEERVRYDDLPDPGDMTANFVASNKSWLPTTALSYGFIDTSDDLTAAQTKGAIARALASWAAVTPLSFTEVGDCGLPFDDAGCTSPHIRIQFEGGNHGDPEPFGGPGGVLAHAYFPPPGGLSSAGDAHFDEDETWKLDGTAFDLETVALHEFGHSLGLGHAGGANCDDVGQNSIMCPFYGGQNRTLSADDIAGIQSIYGAPQNMVTSVAVTPESASIPEATSFQLTAVATRANGATEDVTETATWTSNNPDIAVSAFGSVFGNAPGVATITATFDGVSDTSTITVIGADPLAICQNLGPIPAGYAVRVGTPGPDTMNGTTAKEVFFGLGGNDTISGRGGEDIICGGEGDDRLTGGSGNTVMSGGNGNDSLTDPSGNDRMYGGYGNDRLAAGSGNDRLFGNGGDDRLDGGSGTDDGTGGAGVDTFVAIERRFD